MKIEIRLTNETLKKHAITCDIADQKLVAFSLAQLEADVQATRERLLRESLVGIVGKMPSKNQVKRRIHIIPDASGNIVYWNTSKNGDIEDSVKLVAAYTDTKIGTDPEQANKIVAIWHYVDLSKATYEQVSNGTDASN